MENFIFCGVCSSKTCFMYNLFLQISYEGFTLVLDLVLRKSENL